MSLTIPQCLRDLPFDNSVDPKIPSLYIDIYVDTEDEIKYGFSNGFEPKTPTGLRICSSNKSDNPMYNLFQNLSLQVYMVKVSCALYNKFNKLWDDRVKLFTPKICRLVLCMFLKEFSLETCVKYLGLVNHEEMLKLIKEEVNKIKLYEIELIDGVEKTVEKFIEEI